ncbi:MAG: heterodisulfide reductase-related iron-sulfur binding cluster [Gammaproteobacteria bacterium]|jgi:Fe-S oxidoreductase
MTSTTEGTREGSLEAPTRHALDWTGPSFYDEENLFRELQRVFDICHGCRRCFNLCNSFPTLFDAIDESDTMELDGVAREAYWDVVDHCYLCDMCYMTKCPYVPPHEWNVDFPHLMLRAKAVRFKKGKARMRDRILTSTDTVGKLAGIPVVVQMVNATNKSSLGRKALDRFLGVHPDAILPEYHAKTSRKRIGKGAGTADSAVPAGPTTGKVVLYTTCYGNYNEPGINQDLVAILQHNDIAVTLARKEQCCGMPKLELGDLDAVKAARDANIPELLKLVDEGWDIVAPIPSCVLMYKQELPLMFPDDTDVARVRDAIFDPFEYLMLRHKHGLLKTDFKTSLGKISYHVACHLRVQNIGMKTRDLLQLIPDTSVEPIERCSGHDGTYAVKRECHEISMKICRPVVNSVKKAEAAHYSSDCPMAGHQIENGLENGKAPEHPLTLLRMAYGI